MTVSAVKPVSVFVAAWRPTNIATEEERQPSRISEVPPSQPHRPAFIMSETKGEHRGAALFLVTRRTLLTISGILNS